MDVKSVLTSWKQVNEQSKKSETVEKLPSLAFCVVMDLLGMATFILPFLGEWFDLVWAPISAMMFFRAFGGMTGAIGSVVNLTEELLPGLDVIPTFTIGYFYTKYKMKKK
ncbi:conserved hypothetical protein [uncultured Paludibacter sp.]|nr:conserved hypothetical protein [uncultured Paludibacter sp.]